MNGGVLSDARVFDVAKGVLIALRGCSIDEALAELVSVAERHRVGVLALARALVALATPRTPQLTDDAAAQAAVVAFGHLLAGERHGVVGSMPLPAQ